MRRSGKRGLIQLQRGTDALFDVSGLSADGFGRANEFSFSIEGVTEEAAGYNDAWSETVPIGESKWTASITVFYNAASNEVNDYLWTMWTEQHNPDACTDAQEYTLWIKPEGDCTGKESWEGSRAVIKKLDIQTPAKNIMTIKAEFGGFEMERDTIS